MGASKRSHQGVVDAAPGRPAIAAIRRNDGLPPRPAPQTHRHGDDDGAAVRAQGSPCPSRRRLAAICRKPEFLSQAGQPFSTQADRQAVRLHIDPLHEEPDNPSLLGRE